MRYKSVSHATRNEKYEQQVEIEYERTFLQWLFCKPNTKQVFVGSGGSWHHKDSGRSASLFKTSEIIDIICFCKYHH
jgi:hypothetical protein